MNRSRSPYRPSNYGRGRYQGRFSPRRSPPLRGRSSSFRGRPYPRRRWSRSPVRRRSPMRHSSPWRRSPMRHSSPRRRSPMQHMNPRRKSPYSRSPYRRSPPKHSPSRYGTYRSNPPFRGSLADRSLDRRQSSSPDDRRSHSPVEQDNCKIPATRAPTFPIYQDKFESIRKRSPSKLSDLEDSDKGHGFSPEYDRLEVLGKRKGVASSFEDATPAKKVLSEDLEVTITAMDIVRADRSLRGPLHPRFGDMEPKFKSKVKITIGIEREISGETEEATVRRHLNVDQVVVMRYKGEGAKKLHQREEFKTKLEEHNLERRTVHIQEEGSSHPATSLNDRWQHQSPLGGPAEWEKKISEPQIRRKEDERVVVNSRYAVGNYPGPEKGIQRDQRVVLNAKRSFDYQQDDVRDLRSRLRGGRRGQSGYSFRGNRGGNGDMRHWLGKDFYDSSQSEQTSELPDFSKRPDKYQYKEWLTQPDVTPRSGYYFEHDNRDEPFFPRGRGRGHLFRGRGFRGRIPGRGNYYNNRPADAGGSWKHDKYEEVAQEEPEKPSSTTN